MLAAGIAFLRMFQLGLTRRTAALLPSDDRVWDWIEQFRHHFVSKEKAPMA